MRIGLGEIILGFGWSGSDGCITRLPVNGAYFVSVGISELDGLNESKSFIDRSSNWWIILGDLSQNSFFVDNEESSQ